MTTPEPTTQADSAFRFDWGGPGLDALTAAGDVDVLVIVDVLRFGTAVSVACDRGAVVYPFEWGDDRAPAFAGEVDAVLAGRREDGPVSLSPTDLGGLPVGTRIVLPSPNGSALSMKAAEAGVPFVLAGCLRNAGATARRAATLAHGGTVAVVAAGERWPHDGSLRPCVADLLGAGAILHGLDPAAAATAPRCSPEAAAARDAFVSARPLLHESLARSASGRELLARGWADDVECCAVLDASPNAVELVDGSFRAAA